MRLAEDLMSQSIEVLLDKWDLQPGHDSNAFMEKMVADESVTKVLMIFDEAYARKSNERTGGAGTEAQIITAKLYKETQQDKFAAVVFEKDEMGNPFIPTYYSSRIHFDLTDTSEYSSVFEQIVRWAWGKPKFVRPEKGSKPAFLNENDNQGGLNTSAQHRRAIEALKSGAATASSTLKDYLNVFVVGFENFRIQMSGENRETFDDEVLKSIDKLIPYRNQIVEVFSCVAAYSPSETNISIIHRFLENLLPYFESKENISSYGSFDFDNYKYIVNDIFLHLIAVLIKNEQYDFANYFIVNEYYFDKNLDNKMVRYNEFRTHLESLEYRKNRLGLNRTSLHADMLKDYNAGTGIDLKYLMAADFILFWRGINLGYTGYWWPHTLMYVDRYNGPFEMFARAKSRKYFDKIKKLLNVSSAQEFSTDIKALMTDYDRLPRWNFARLNVVELSGEKYLATID